MLAVIACHDKLTAGERRGEEREGEGGGSRDRAIRSPASGASG